MCVCVCTHKNMFNFVYLIIYIYIYIDRGWENGLQVRVYRGFPVTCINSRVHGRSSNRGLPATAKIDSGTGEFYPRRRSCLCVAICFQPNTWGQHFFSRHPLPFLLPTTHTLLNTQCHMPLIIMIMFLKKSIVGLHTVWCFSNSCSGPFATHNRAHK